MAQGLKTQYNAPIRTDQYGVIRNRFGQVQNPEQVYANNGVPQQGQYAISQAGDIRGYSDKPVDLGNSGWWNDYDTSRKDDYNQAVNAINKSGRIYEGESFPTIGLAEEINWFDGNPENKSYRGSYATGNNPYANAFNNYLNSGMNWNDYSNAYSKSYSNDLDKQSQGLFDNWWSGKNMDFGSLVDQRNQELYDNAKAKVDRDYARGYLNNNGYQQALDELNSQKSYNRNLLDMESTALQDKWTTDAKQAIVQNFPKGDWISNWGKAWDTTDALKALDNYGQGVNEDFFKAGLVSNSYDPGAYVATGAANQGLYNPYAYTGVNRKRKLFDSIGEF